MKKKSLVDDEVAAEAMVSRAVDDSDVDEDCEVADLSSIPAPQIGFKMPNLKPLKATKKEKAPEKQKGKTLTAQLLNNEIVNMRGSVAKAQRYISGQLSRTLKMLSGKTEKKPDEKLAKKVARLEEDIKTIKTLAKDEVSKFALLNKKTKNQLPFTATTPVTERCLYHLATGKPVLEAVQEFRKKYIDWEVRTAYFLQRLGTQYQSQKADKKASGAVSDEDEESDKEDAAVSKATKVEKKSGKVAVKTVPEEDTEQDEEAEENEASDDDKEQKDEEDDTEEIPENEQVDDSDDKEDDSDEDDEEEISDVEMGSGSEDDELIEQRRKALFELAGIKEDTSRPKIAPKPRKLPIEDENESEVKEEPKKVVSKEESKAALQNILKKTLETQVPKSVKNIMKLKAELKEENRKVKGVKRAPPKLEEQASSTTVVKKVKLSAGGVVELKSASAEEKEPANEDDDASDTPISSFFLSADGSSSRANHDSSGEESVDDDADMDITPLPKKGGQMRKMSAARQKLQSKLENRPFERQKKMAQKREEVMKKKSAFAGATKNEKSQKVESEAPETLHPSWAARVQKKKELQNAKPQGKRMVFDDDD